MASKIGTVRLFSDDVKRALSVGVRRTRTCASYFYKFTRSRWAGGPFQAEGFDLKAVNKTLSRMRWPVRHSRRCSDRNPDQHETHALKHDHTLRKTLQINEAVIFPCNVSAPKSSTKMEGGFTMNETKNQQNKQENQHGHQNQEPKKGQNPKDPQNRQTERSQRDQSHVPGHEQGRREPEKQPTR
jgi:hypothetical protein